MAYEVSLRSLGYLVQVHDVNRPIIDALKSDPSVHEYTDVQLEQIIEIVRNKPSAMMDHTEIPTEYTNRGSYYKRSKNWSYTVDIGKDETGKRKQKTKSGFKTKKDAKCACARYLYSLHKLKEESMDN